MKHFLGIDLGTSGLKILLVNEEGEIRGSVAREYKFNIPQPGWSEQSPALWWEACREGLREIMNIAGDVKIEGVGVGGQMHGLVVLDAEDRVIRPAILWNDGRTAEETAYLNEEIGKERLSELTANIAFSGFTAPKLLWMRKHEPENFQRIEKIMLPKDYLVYCLTGRHCCDYSDASGMLLLDVKNRCWSKEMTDICGVREEQLPTLFESSDVVGYLREDVADELGLPRTVRVVAGAGDNAAAAVGTGTVQEGACNISLGTSGTIFISSEKFRVDPNNALHAFANAAGGFHLMGCMLSAASCNQWFCEDILRTTDYAAEQASVAPEKLGRGQVFFLPYLMGERSPINDTDIRGMFLGLGMDTTRADMVQAVLEGVAFAIRDSLEVAKSLGLKIERSGLCGGGARSALWRTILSNVLQLPLDIPQTEEGPGYGAAMLAMVGCGAYPSVADCAEHLVRVAETVYPTAEIAARYEKQYQKFQRIYPAVKGLL